MYIYVHTNKYTKHTTSALERVNAAAIRTRPWRANGSRARAPPSHGAPRWPARPAMFPPQRTSRGTPTGRIGARSSGTSARRGSSRGASCGRTSATSRRSPCAPSRGRRPCGPSRPATCGRACRHTRGGSPTVLRPVCHAILGEPPAPRRCRRRCSQRPASPLGRQALRAYPP